MILYKLKCEDDHSFDVWFRNSGAYDSQIKTGDVECPYCGSRKITKAPMAPSIASGAKESGDSQDVDGAANDEVVSGVHDALLSDERTRELAEKFVEAVETLRRHAEGNFEDVGENFADEARAIHYGDKEDRGIYGQATEEDAAELEEEGIEFFRLPTRRRVDG